jgi:glycosyltransferase involved in cell wall biosynthesis
MRVLEVLPSIASEGGGSVRSTLSNCRAICAADPGFRFVLATTDQGLESGWCGAFKAQMPRGMEVEVFPAIGRRAFIFSPWLAGWLWRHVREFDLVVVRRLFNPLCSAAAGIAHHRGVPYVVVPHGTVSRYTFAWRRTLLKRAYFRLVDRRTLAGAAAVRFTSGMERDEAPIWEGLLSSVIPHPYESRFALDNGWNRIPHQILFLSRLHPKKGVETVLEAMRVVLRERPDARLVLAGSGEGGYESRVRSQIRRLGLEGAVELPGFVEGTKKRSLLTGSSVFVLLSAHENFGLAAVEAMDAGLPLVISRGVHIWPEVHKAGAGIVVQERTAREVAEALLRLLRDVALRRERGRKGRELVRTAFEPTKVGRELVDLYRAAAGVRRPSA